MGKWRPSSECLYVIPDIHGMYNELELILSRILPLRKTNGVLDKIIFLGDYVDRRPDSHKVLDRLISLKDEYPDQVITLCGNHEIMFLDGFAPAIDSNRYTFWMRYGGDMTLQGYLQRAESVEKSVVFDPYGFGPTKYQEEKGNPYTFPRQRIKDLIPQEHIDFINSLDFYYEDTEYIFVHGGCDPLKPMSEQSSKVFIWDRSLFNLISGVQGEPHFPWDKCIVTGHNGDTGEPLIKSKFMMLDCSCDNKLFVMEMNSREAFVAKVGKKRLVKWSSSKE